MEEGFEVEEQERQLMAASCEKEKEIHGLPY